MARHAATLAMSFGAAFLPATSQGQARQPFSLQGSVLYTVQELGTAGSVGGAGAELQARYNPNQFSVGVGFQVSHHESGDQKLNLLGLFLEPRVAIDAGSDRVTPYVAGRIVLLRQSSDFVTVPEFSSLGTAFGLGGGLLFHLAPRANLDAGAAYLRQSFDDKTFSNGAKVDFSPFNGYVVKVGLTFGIGHR
jgi:hypothetical protein